MALFHIRHKILSRSSRNTVGALAYRSGTQLTCSATGLVFDYTLKEVQHVEILLPENAPAWAKDLQALCREDRQGALQKLSTLVEAAEKRIDAQVYREIEFALPRELNDQQGIELANELIQDQACGRGMLALQCFHFEVDETTGERKPHCHTVLLTRRLTDAGLSPLKERDWNKKEFHTLMMEQVAAYTNFHLKKHGIDIQIDHRSYAERGIGLEPQPKLGWGALRQEDAAGGRPQDLEGKSVTDKGKTYQHVKLRNLYRVMSAPEILLKEVTSKQTTFVWRDVEKSLARYVDDPGLFHSLSGKLKGSSELVCLVEDPSPAQSVYTTKSVLTLEKSFVETLKRLQGRKGFSLDPARLDALMANANKALQEKTGDPFAALSKDQEAALAYLRGPESVLFLEGIAGAGKTTVLSIMKEAWAQEGYQVYGVAPTGRAAKNLSASGIASQTLHSFLKAYESGRYHLRRQSVLVLDEAGMVDLERFSKLLAATEKLGIKLVCSGDRGQLPSVEAGVALRLGIATLGKEALTTVVRQKEPWQQEATQLFGADQAAAALDLYKRHGALHWVREPYSSFKELHARGDSAGLVDQYIRASRLSRALYSAHKDGFQKLEVVRRLEAIQAPLPPALQEERQQLLAAFEKIRPALEEDAQRLQAWRLEKVQCATFLKENLDKVRPFLKERGVDPLELARVFYQTPEEINVFLNAAKLPKRAPQEPGPFCEVRAATRQKLVADWFRSYKAHPHDSHVVMAYHRQDVLALNTAMRTLLKAEGEISKEEVRYATASFTEKDFGKRSQTKEERSFSVGDHLLFTKNDRGLGVQNGTLGRIVALSPQKIQVALLEEDRTVSFAPKLYPYIDHGWALTIHKLQGTTVDRSFVLASYDMFKNLTYVAMTRHRKEVNVYGSSLDFWREEILTQRLARAQEKLSALDYVSERAWEDFLRPEAPLLQKTLERLGNRLTALGYVGKEAWKGFQEWFLEKPPEEPLLLRDLRGDFESQRALKLLGTGKEAAQGPSLEHLRAFEKRLQGDSLSPPLPQDKKRPTFLKTDFTKADWEALCSRISSAAAREHRGLRAYLRSTYGFERVEKVDHILRYGKKGSFVLNIGGAKAGLYYSHERGEGGTLIQLCQREMGMSFQEALQYLSSAASLRDKERIEALFSKEKGRGREAFLNTPSLQEEAEGRQKALTEERAQQDQKHAEVQALVHRTRPLPGTPGESYLRHERAIQGSLPEDLRYLPPQTTFTYGGKERRSPEGALVSLARNEKGEVTALQLTSLTKEGKRARTKAGEKLAKITYGVPKGSFVLLQKGKETDPLYIAEGVETALSLKEAGIKGSLYCSLGSANLKNLASPPQEIVIAADWDGSFEAPAWQSVLKAKKLLEDKGPHVTVVLPCLQPENEKGKIDFNDVLKEKGESAVQALLQHHLKGPLLKKEIKTPKLREEKRAVNSLLRNKELDSLIARSYEQVPEGREAPLSPRENKNEKAPHQPQPFRDPKDKALNLGADPATTQLKKSFPRDLKGPLQELDKIQESIKTLEKLYSTYERTEVGNAKRKAWANFERKALEVSPQVLSYLQKDCKEIARAVETCKEAQRDQGREFSR